MDENKVKLPELLKGEEYAKMDEEFLRSDEWITVDISGNLLDPAEEYVRPDYTLTLDGVPFAPLGGIHALTGQPGNGKTMTFTQIIVAILRGECGRLRYNLADKIEKPRVLYIDTEMEKGHTQLVNLRVYSMMGWEFGRLHEEFRILWLRKEVDAMVRWRKTLKAIYELRPNVVFLDGLLDVIGDFNDNKECQSLIYRCMATSSHYNISMWCLLHENPGTTKMVGHLGSFLERKVTDAFATIKEKDKNSGIYTFTVKQKKARGKDVDDWQFNIENGPHDFGIPRQILPAVVEPVEKALTPEEKMEREDPAEVMRSIITSHEGITTRDLCVAIKSHFSVGQKKAEKYIQKCYLELGIISRADNKRYHLSALSKDPLESVPGDEEIPY